VWNGHVNSLFRSVPHSHDGTLAHVLRASYASALNDILLVEAIITFV